MVILMTSRSSVTHPYRSKEEMANSITHALGVVFGIVALILLILKAISIHADILSLVSYTVYGVSIILLYLASTLYHFVSYPRAKRVLKIFDHCAIYVLIAGTYTPFLLISLKTPLAISLMVIIWLIALIGIVLKILFVYRFKALSLATYLIMGWLSLVVIYQLASVISITGLLLLIGGGVVYSIGVLFYVKDSIAFNHAIWHLFVLIGTILHFLSIYWYVNPA